MHELSVKTGRRHVPLYDLPVRLGRAGAAREIGDMIDALIAFMDDLDGDPDLEETDAEDSFALSVKGLSSAAGAGCPISDPGGGNIEDEPHDAEEDCCLAGDDAVIAGPVVDRGYWLTKHRSFYPHGQEIGDEHDAEYDMRRAPRTLSHPVPDHEAMVERGNNA